MTCSMKQERNILKKRFVDTNIFIYTLFSIDKNKQNQCVTLFKQAAEGKVILWTTVWVIAEIIWFLQKQNIPNKQTKQVITRIIATKGLEVADKQWLLEVLDLWEESIDFIDIVNLSLARAHSIIEGYSYDKDLDTLNWFKRSIP